MRRHAIYGRIAGPWGCHPQKRQHQLLERALGQPKPPRTLRWNTQNGSHTRVRQIASRMPWQIDERPSNHLSSECSGALAGDADMLRIGLPPKLRKIILQLR